ncbi:MAG: hypothetical protein LBF12_00315 [Christensenellaceae bacterium]|jgi:hypothetical protein|nr:hypothetical protein [Christensenellaceae bacterium]
MKKISISILILLLLVLTVIITACGESSKKTEARYEVDSIQVVNFPTSLNIGDPLPQYITLQVIYKDKSGPKDGNGDYIEQQTLSLTESMIKGFSTDVAGICEVEIHFANLMIPASFVVNDTITMVALDAKSWKYEYYLNEPFQENGLVLISYKSGSITSTTYNPQEAPGGFTTANAGDYSIKIKLFDFDVTYFYTVVDQEQPTENPPDDPQQPSEDNPTSPPE